MDLILLKNFEIDTQKTKVTLKSERILLDENISKGYSVFINLKTNEIYAGAVYYESEYDLKMGRGAYYHYAESFPPGTIIEIVDRVIHCETGPAIYSVYNDSWRGEYYLNGRKVTVEELFERMTDEQKENAIWRINELT